MHRIPIDCYGFVAADPWMFHGMPTNSLVVTRFRGAAAIAPPDGMGPP